MAGIFEVRRRITGQGDNGDDAVCQYSRRQGCVASNDSVRTCTAAVVPVGLAASGVFRGGAPPVYMHVAGGVQVCTGFERQQPEAEGVASCWLLGGGLCRF